MKNELSPEVKEWFRKQGSIGGKKFVEKYGKLGLSKVSRGIKVKEELSTSPSTPSIDKNKERE